MPTHHQGPPEEVRALDAFVKLVRATSAVVARTNRPLAGEGLTVGQFGVLETLYHLGPLHQCDLARKHLQSGGNITMIVDNLERSALVRRERLVEDRRYVRVHLTDAGHARIAAIFPAHVRSVVNQMAALTAEEQDELSRLCRKLGLGGGLETVAAFAPVPPEAWIDDPQITKACGHPAHEARSNDQN